MQANNGSFFVNSVDDGLQLIQNTCIYGVVSTGNMYAQMIGRSLGFANCKQTLGFCKL